MPIRAFIWQEEPLKLFRQLNQGLILLALARQPNSIKPLIK